MILTLFIFRESFQKNFVQPIPKMHKFNTKFLARMVTGILPKLLMLYLKLSLILLRNHCNIFIANTFMKSDGQRFESSSVY